MFRALLCSSSGGQIVLYSMWYRHYFWVTVQYTGYERILVTCVLNSHLKRVTVPDAALSFPRDAPLSVGILTLSWQLLRASNSGNGDKLMFTECQKHTQPVRDKCFDNKSVKCCYFLLCNWSSRPGRKQANVSIRMAWISFGALPCRKKNNLMTACV